jgi:hypothetical protein
MKSNIISFIRFYFVAMAAAILLGNVDYELAKRTGRGWLSVTIGFVADGGSVERTGFGYTLTCRHRIRRQENERTIYLVGPELKPWNVFNVFGARRLLDRHYGDELYYEDTDQTEKVIRISIAGDRVGQTVFLAAIDLLPLAALLAAFGVWTRIRRHIPAKTPPAAE